MTAQYLGWTVTESEPKALPAFRGVSLISVKYGGGHRSETQKIVLVNGERVGFVTKFANTRTDTHPWKLYLGFGENAKFLGVEYGNLAQAISLFLLFLRKTNS